MFMLLMLLPGMLFMYTQVQAEAAGLSGNTPDKRTTVLDISIHQPDVEACFDDVSIADIRGQSDWIRVYPNPSPGIFTLELDIQQEGQTIQIFVYDLVGKIVHQTTENPDGDRFSRNLDISFLKNGMYFIHVMGRDHTGVKQIIINQ